LGLGKMGLGEMGGHRQNVGSRGYLPCACAWPVELNHRVGTDDTLVPNSVNKELFIPRICLY